MGSHLRRFFPLLTYIHIKLALWMRRSVTTQFLSYGRMQTKRENGRMLKNNNNLENYSTNLIIHIREQTRGLFLCHVMWSTQEESISKRTPMVAATVSYTRTTSGPRGGSYAEAFCLQPNGYLTLPAVSSYSGGSPSVNPIKEVILSQSSANLDLSYYYYGDYGDYGADEGCTKINASARTAAGKFFSRTSQICLDGFDSALICAFSSTGSYTFECPDTSILAVSTPQPSNLLYDRISVTPKKASGLWGKTPSKVRLNISGCRGYYNSFQQFLETSCGQLKYHFFHAPRSSMGLGYFESEPCGNKDLTASTSFRGEDDCELGNGIYPSSSLNYCNLVGSMPPSTAPPSVYPSKAPTVFHSSDEKSDTSSSNTLPRVLGPLLVVFIACLFVGV